MRKDPKCRKAHYQGSRGPGVKAGVPPPPRTRPRRKRRCVSRGRERAAPSGRRGQGALARVALPSQGSQERAAQKTLAGGVSGCWENEFRGTVPSRAGRWRVGRHPPCQGRGAGQKGRVGRGDLQPRHARAGPRRKDRGWRLVGPAGP
jgi:hypothetical protein